MLDTLVLGDPGSTVVTFAPGVAGQSRDRTPVLEVDPGIFGIWARR